MTARRIVIADDDPAHREILRLVVAEAAPEGCPVIAPELDDVDAAAAAGGELLLFVDHRLGPRDGLEVARTAHQRGESCYTVLMSSTHPAIGADELRAAGVDRTLVKPVELAAYRAVVKDILAAWTGAKES